MPVCVPPSRVENIWTASLIICRKLVMQAGVPEAQVFWRDRKELQGYY